MGTNPSPFDDHALLALQYAEQALCRETTHDFVFALELAVESVRRGLDSSTLDKARCSELSSLFLSVGAMAPTLLPNDFDRELIEAAFAAIQQLLTLWKTPPDRRLATPTDRAFDPHACVRRFNDDLKRLRKAHAAVGLRLIDAQRAAALARHDEESGKVVIPWPEQGTKRRRCPADPIIAQEVLKHFAAAADADDVESVAQAVSLAFRALERGHHSGQITPTLRTRLMRALFLAEERAQRTLPEMLYLDRAQHAFIAAFALILQWTHPPGSRARQEVSSEASRLVVRHVGNELDSLCIEAELHRLVPPSARAGAGSVDHATEETASRG
ncbi:hypothetical protein ASG52_05430 [Methylobacterium sp. Leaf456]|nr:hypothetical protein ASG52_05430 [Methylobacterium sp. Leaf456]